MYVSLKMIFPAWVFLEFWDTNECTDCCDTCQSPCCQIFVGQQRCECLTCKSCPTCDCPCCRKCLSCDPCPACDCRPCRDYPPCQSCVTCECPRCQDCQVCKPCTTCECPTCRACPECPPCDSCDCKRLCECPPCKPCKICNCQNCRECQPCPACQCKPCCDCPPCKACPACECPPCKCCPNSDCKECCENFCKCALLCACLGAISKASNCQKCSCKCPDFCSCRPSSIRNFPLCTLIFTVIGVIGSAYGFIVSSVALDVGPLCRVTQLGEWKHPFAKGNYLNDPNLWVKCLEPENVIPWHVRLFSILLVISAVQFIICIALLVNILFGLFCKDCNCFKGYDPM
uniref:keratin-associated protein 4-9-like isoform X2 n=1 Tax=Pristiophorus japonicus TaxID=55135 RepID=UPI00398E41E3